eukprot:jgi/Hompol1/5305/HPOL_004315-RA
MGLQPSVNLVIERVAADSEFLSEALGDVDAFTRRLFEIHQAVLALPQHQRQPITLGIHRSDYMIHEDSSNRAQSLLQVEVNTISAGLPSLSTITSQLHDFALATSATGGNLIDQFPGGILPKSESLRGVAHAIGTAWTLYDRPGCADSELAHSAVVVMVVQPLEFNMFDQRWIEYSLWETFNVRVIRKTLKEIHMEARHVGPERRLYIGETEVAVVYYRAAYTPRDFPSEDEWDARAMLETSFAVKCPNIAYHLAGTKKVQQMLSAPNVLERFLQSPDEAFAMRSTFAGLYPLDDTPEGEQAFQMAISTPEKYVLKPQREGGGKPPCTFERKTFILMDLIRAPAFEAKVVRNETVFARRVVSELGIYGVWLSNGQTVHINEAVGHLLRTKSADANEGGVASGIGVIDTPFLIPNLTYTF